MAARIEHYGFLGDLKGSALVSREGSVDWLCVPRFDSPACLAALLGRDEHGCWTIYPAANVRSTTRRYRPGTLILETEYACDGGVMRIIDFMPLGEDRHSLLRIVEGVEGEVAFDMSLVVRFEFGSFPPWITRTDDGGYRLTSAPDSIVFRSPVEVEADDRNIRALLEIKRGERLRFELTWCPARQHQAPAPLDLEAELVRTETQWKEWASRSKYDGVQKDAVNRSLVTLRGMIYQPSGGIVAAPTAGLPEEIGGVRNWDYRFCWLRDATLTLDALMLGGYTDEARAWREWLVNAIAGAPEDAQIMYGIEGERRLTEFEIDLPGYEESRPVRIGNAASEQFQLDIYGEVIQALYEGRRLGLPEVESVRSPAKRFMEFLSTAWQRPDDGIWEVRGGRRHFVHSKVMAWVAVDRFVRIVEEFSEPDNPMREMLPRYRALRGRIHRDVCEHGFNAQLNSFTQTYDGKTLDAGLLLIPAHGFLPASDPRVKGTIAAIEKHLLHDGFVLRYETGRTNDGLAGSEGAFLACSFWLVDAYAYAGRRREAEDLFERLLSLQNDVGLLSEEYDPQAQRLIGNFPQAFSHLALIHSASVLSGAEITPRAGANGRAKTKAPEAIVAQR